MNFINIGFSNFIAVKCIIAVVNPESAPIKRLVQTAKADNLLVDATFGRKTQSVIITDCEKIFISSLGTDALLKLIKSKKE